MAEVEATINANVDCTALVHAELAALLVELVVDLRERCKRLESRELVGNAWGAGLSGLQQQLAQVTAERDAARQKQLDEHVEWASFYNGLQANLNTLKAERDAAREQHLVECRRNSAGMEQRLALETQVAGLSSKVRELEKQLAELTKKTGELPPETAPEPYQWQVGDEVIRKGQVWSVEVASRGYVKLDGLYSCGAQSDWERRGWKLHRKASDLPDLPPFTPQQQAEFPAVAEPIDESVGANGEGQS